MTASKPGTDLDKARLSGNELINTPIGTIELVHNYFNSADSDKLFDELDYQRAVQAYLWCHPLVSMTTWRNRQCQAYDVTGPNDFVVLRSLKEKRGVVTGNLTTPYILNFYSLTDGPLLLDYPHGKTAGVFLDFWQRPVINVGLTGPDQGNGGQYIIVGPEDNPKLYESAESSVVQSPTNNIFFGLRILNDDQVFYERFKSTVKMGRLGTSLDSCRFIEDLDLEWSATAPRGIEYWHTLSSIINEEPVQSVDKAWMAMLLPLGIEKDRPFAPDQRQQGLLLKGAAMGELMARNLQVNPRFAEPYWKNTNWYKSFDFTIQQETESRIELDERTTWFYEAVTSSKEMINPKVGAGQVYMTTKRDSRGCLFRADRTYRLTVPKDVPVGQFWALTLYSENTRRPYDNGGAEIRDVSIDSMLSGLNFNSNGSIDLYIGNRAPVGCERNFLKTVSDDGWFVYFRLYAPLLPFFDKTFSLPDFELIS